MSIRNILLVDDSPLDVDLTKRALEAYRLVNEIDVARDGDEALDYLYCRGRFASRKPGIPILVLLDLQMPKVDGIEVLRTIRADPDLKRIPVVVLTSSREQKDIIQIYDLGVNAYIVKPVEHEKFFDAVKQIGMFWLLMNEPPLG